MDRLTAAAFWSYAHADNVNSGGQVDDLANAIAREYELITGIPLELFRDSDDIKIGEIWRQRLDDALTDAAFLLPVLTPTYFNRPECRKELLYFLGEAKSLGVDSLIIPILYVPVADLDLESSDELKRSIARIQWIDWTDLRLEEQSSAAVRRAVNAVAKRMAETSLALQSAAASRTDTAQRIISSASVQLRYDEGTDGYGEDDEPGQMDLLAAMEDVLPSWIETIEALPQLTAEFGRLTEVATEKIQEAESQGQASFALRVRVARELASELESPVAEFEDTMGRYARQLVDIDAGVRASIELASAQGSNPDGLESICEGFAAIRGLVATTRESAASALSLGVTIGQTARMSKDLRPVLNRMRSALQDFADTQSLLDRWEQLIDESGVDCAS